MKVAQTFESWMKSEQAASPFAGWTREDWAAHNARVWGPGGPGLSSPHISPRLRNRDEFGLCVDDFQDVQTYLRRQDYWRQKIEAADRLEKRAGEGKLRLPPAIPAWRADWAENGAVAIIKPPKSCGKPPQGGDGRGVVWNFSKDSRHRLLSFVNSIDQMKIPADRLFFLTLTYPKIWPKDPAEWKMHLDAFHKRVDRAWGPIPAIWKLEPQRRGAPHFHLILIVPKSMVAGLKRVGERQRGGRKVGIWEGGALAEFRQWISRAWYEVVGSKDQKHWRAGTSVEPMESWTKAGAYAAKYMGKDCWLNRCNDDGEPLSVGRFWGVWRKEEWPRQWKSSELDAKSFHQLRRWMRKYLEKHGKRVGPLGSRACGAASCFIPAKIFERWVDSLAWWNRAGLSYRQLVKLRNQWGPRPPN